MGYSTQFNGELRFATEATASQLAALNEILGEDCRDHPDWNASGLYHVDFKLTDDFSGIEWDGSEKSYEMHKIANVIIRQMRKRWPDFGLTGQMSAQGEDIEDRWVLCIGDDGFAERRDVAIVGTTVKCPHCAERFILEEATKSA